MSTSRGRTLWIGGAVTAALFVAGKFLIGLYLGVSSTTSTYGMFGALVAMLIWIYYSAQIFFFGAECTQVYARRYGSMMEPEEGAHWRADAETRATGPEGALPSRPLRQLRPIGRDGSRGQSAGALQTMHDEKGVRPWRLPGRIGTST